MNRDKSLQRIAAERIWDIAVIGGGATGVAIAMDAASRGYSVCLVEQSDFGKGTSSRSTKLIHGGVRYLQQGNVSLVMEALKERGILRQNAPHLVDDLMFVVPNYEWWEAPFYGIGLKIYDMLAFRYGFGGSKHLSKAQVIERIPTLEQEGLRGGIVYHDGQFDDARLLINMAQTAEEHNAALINYAPVTELNFDGEHSVTGFKFTDLESSVQHDVFARCVINATGAFCDGVRRMDEPGAEPMIAASQGIHIVLDRSFLPGDAAIMVPRTSDGRVMFAIPWHGHTLIGTTDTPIENVTLEPIAQEQEIQFLLETAARYLTRNPERGDILSVFAGIRPLVKAGEASSTAALSRDHTIHISKTGLITIAGGKWTTCRKMAEDCVDHAAIVGKLDERGCVTKELRIHGCTERLGPDMELSYFGSDAAAILSMMQAAPELNERLSQKLPIRKGEIVWAARHEMARTLDDALARRTRALFLNAKAALEMAPETARLMAAELGRDEKWQREQLEQFEQIAQSYVVR